MSVADLVYGFGDTRFCGTICSGGEIQGVQKSIFFDVINPPPKILIIFFVIVYMLVKTSENIFRG